MSPQIYLVVLLTVPTCISTSLLSLDFENVTFCGKDGNPLATKVLGSNFNSTCILQMESGKNDQLFHNIWCINPMPQTLKSTLEIYSDYGCNKPLKLYLPTLDFVPDREVFHPVASVLNTLIIKEWTPCSNFDCDLGSPFFYLSELRILDIHFKKHIHLRKIKRHFLEGLDSLEALILENLPDKVVLEKGIFPGKNEYKNLQCLSLMASNISCSCKVDDPMYWLHRWLSANPYVWAAKGHKMVTYTDRLTAYGAFDTFPCKVDLSCVETLEFDQYGEAVVTKVTDFHAKHWKKTCASTTTTFTPPTPEPDELKNLAHLMDEPVAQPIINSANVLMKGLIYWCIFILINLVRW